MCATCLCPHCRERKDCRRCHTCGEYTSRVYQCEQYRGHLDTQHVTACTTRPYEPRELPPHVRDPRDRED